MENRETSKSKQIRTLFITIFSAVGLSVLLVILGVYYYSPTGAYKLRYALLSPELVVALSYNDVNNKTGGNSRFVFDEILFSYLDPQDKQYKTVSIDPMTYQKFYQLILQDSSLHPVSDEVRSLFNRSIATLSIKVRTESHAAWQDETKIFQSLSFAPSGNDYRIELHEQKNPDPWVYFHHPHIYQQTFDLFIPK